MRISDLFDIQELRELCESFTAFTGATTAILDLEGNILVATGWHDICSSFHRCNSETALLCHESDTDLACQIQTGAAYTIYTCRNGLIDVAAPIMIEGEPVATFFTGQFFLAPPDRDFFIRQAETYGFDKSAYMEALEKVPIISEDRVKTMMSFYTRLTALISNLGLSRLRLEKLKIEEELRINEERWKLALEGAGDGLWDWDVQTNKVYFSRQLKAMLGFEEHEIGDDPLEWENLMHPEDREGVYTAIIKHLAGETAAYVSEHRVRCKDGAYKWVLARGRVITYSPEGQPLRFIGTHTDLTERKRAEDLIRIQSDLSGVLSSTSDLTEALERVLHRALQIDGIDCGGIYLADPHTGDLDLAAHTGLTPQFVAAASHLPYNTPNVELAAAGKPFIVEYLNIERVRNANRDQEGLRALAICPILHAGKLVAVMVFASHIHTEISPQAMRAFEDLSKRVGGVIARIRAQTALHESQTNLQTLFDSMDDMLFILDADGHILKTNPTACHQLGYAEADLTAKRFFDLLSPEQHSQMESMLADMLAGGVSVCHIPLLTKDGTLLPAETKISLGTWDGRAAIFGFSRDITERLRAEETRIELDRRIQHAQKLESLGLLAGGIAHDFNNLLMAMLGNLDLTLMDLAPSSRPHTLISKAMHAARRAADLTTQMLTYSGKGHSEVRRMDLSTLVRENATLLKTVIPKTVSLNLALSIESALIEADPNQVQQVMMNLITNAVEAIGERTGLITVTTGVGHFDEHFLGRSRLVEKLASGRYVYMDVSDTGCGMDEDTQQRLFDPFFSSKFTGRGLGMSAVMGIVRAHKGAIFVDSTLDQGTTIRVLFPALAADSAYDAATSVRASAAWDPSFSTGTVLVVDDEPEVLEVCREYVQQLGFKVMTAADGAEAVNLYRQYSDEIVCVLLDMMMPILDGLGTFQEFKKHRADIPVILCSGFNALEATRRFSNQGLAGFIQKPFRLRELQEIIVRVLHRGGMTAP